MNMQETRTYYPLRRALSRRLLVATTSAAMLVPQLPAPLAARQASPPGSPATTPSFETLDALLASVIEKGMPGIALAVERDGQLVYSGAAGVASLEEQTPLQPTDRFRIYSITKTFVATLVLQLVDEGTLTLEDTVGQWLLDPAVVAIPNVDTVTLRHLLNHTSGIYDYGDDDDSPFWDDAFLGPEADWTKVWTLPELLAYADGDNHAPYFDPGKWHHYANTNYVLLGMIVEKATGQTFNDELGGRILTPLGLADTFLAEGGSMPDGVVDGYELIDGAFVNVSVSNLSWVWTAGGMVSTTADLLRFARAVYSGELLSPESHAEMFAFIPVEKPGMREGMGLYEATTPQGVLAGMDGGSAGFNSYMMRHEEGGVTVVVLANWDPDDGTVYSVRDQAIIWTLAHPH